MHSTKTNLYDLRRSKEKENRQPEKSLNSGSNGALPKRYQSVFTEGTPLTTFGVRNDSEQLRSHSPPNRIESQSHHRQLKPVREFLSTFPVIDQQSDDRRHSNANTNGHTQLQTTVQNVDAALARTLSKLRQEPLTKITNRTASSVYAKPIPTRQNIGKTTNYSHQTKRALPVELITKRPIQSDNSPNVVTQDRISSADDLPVVQQSIPITNNDVRSIDPLNSHTTTPVHLSTKSLDTALHQLDTFHFNTIQHDENSNKLQKSKRESNPQSTYSTTSRKKSFGPTVNNQQLTLPEVSVNPHIQSSIQKTDDQTGNLVESNDQIRSQQINENNLLSNHRLIHVEPTNTFKQTSTPTRHQSIFNIQQQRLTSSSSIMTPNSTTNIILTKDPFNDAYIERDHSTDLQIIMSPNRDNENDSPRRQYENQHEKSKTFSGSRSSSITQEINRVWKKQKNKFSLRSSTTNSNNHKNFKVHRPPGRLKNYQDCSESETTATETQSKDEGMAHRQGLPPSDLGSDAWSDLASEFSDSKIRKHPNVRTSTPNLTRHSSSLSSKEVGQIRRQLTDLQTMYHDLLRLLDVDIESLRSSLKSSTSSQVEHNSRKYRFRKVAPATSINQTNIDMREINQRFARIESSIVTLAESIAKLSAQIQTQRMIKDDVHHLRQEVAELRQQLHYFTHRQQSSTPTGVASSMSTTSQYAPRLITANVQRLVTTNNPNRSNISASFIPSTSVTQRSNSIIDPRQARKIEQFFGPEAMLRYFLNLLNYEEYAPILEREKIGIYELPYISERKLQSFGIPYGPCARIIHEAQQYFISLLTLKSTGIDV